MDEIHQPYIGYIRDTAGLLYRVAWAPTNPGAKTFPLTTVFRSNRYDPDSPWDMGGAGAVPTMNLDWSPYAKSGIPKRVCGDCYLGEDEWWETGDFPSGAPPVAMSPDGFATDCSGGPVGVTSVGLAADPTFIVSGSPVTSIGTISLDWADVPAGYALQGPASGPDATPTFRPLSSSGLPFPASVSLDGATQYLLYSGTGLQSAPGAGWCVNLWCKLNSVVPTNMLYWSYDPVSGQQVELYVASGQLVFAGSSAFGLCPDITTPYPLDGDWHMISAGYSAAEGGQFLAIDAGLPLVTTPISALLGITGNQVWIGAASTGGPVVDWVDGLIDEVAIFGTVTDDDFGCLYNSGDGVFYRQVCCDTFHRVVAWFSMDETSGNRVDWLSAMAFVPTGAPPAAEAICGFRAEPLRLIPGSITIGGILSIENIVNWTNQSSPPPAPPSGTTNLYIDPSGALVTMDPSGVVTPVVNSGPNKWVRYDMTWTDTQTVFVGEHFYLLAPIPANRVILRILSMTTITWAGGALNGATGPVNSVDTSLQTHYNSCSGTTQATPYSQWNEPSGDTNFASNGTYFLGVVAQTGVTPTAGHTTFWVEVYDFIP